VQKSNFEDWVGDDDDGYYYQERQNNARKNNRKKNKKKNQHQQRPAQILDWDDIYDPTRPNSYADYKGSDEQYREHRDWKARLYYWQLQDVEKEKQKNEGQNRKPMNSTCSALHLLQSKTNFVQACSHRQHLSTSHRQASTILPHHSRWTRTMIRIHRRDPQVADGLLATASRLHYPLLRLRPLTMQPRTRILTSVECA